MKRLAVLAMRITGEMTSLAAGTFGFFNLVASQPAVPRWIAALITGGGFLASRLLSVGGQRRRKARRDRRRAASRRLEARQDWNARVVRYASQFPGFGDPRRRGAAIRMADRHLREDLASYRNGTAR
jgi:hypothetical protein